jgi:predicted transcriptional regulator
VVKLHFIDGDDDVFRAAAFGIPDRRDLEEGYRRLDEYSRNLTERAAGYIQRTRDTLTRLFDPSVRRALHALNTTKRGMYRDNVIQFLDAMDEIAQAPDRMRRWILANPRLRGRYHSQSIEAWGSKPGAFDVTPMNERDPYWTAIQNGVAKAEVQEDETVRWVTEYEYGAHTVEGESELLLEEQLDLLATHDVVDYACEMGIDPTSRFLEKL